MTRELTNISEDLQPVVAVRLVVEVEYTPNGVSANELRDMLSFVMQEAAGDGRLTRGTPAEIASLDMHTEVRKVNKRS